MKLKYILNYNKKNEFFLKYLHDKKEMVIFAIIY